MATDGPTPPPCNPDVFSKGIQVAVLHSMGSCWIERWVKKVAARSGQPVDWHFFGGRANVLALGDLGKVAEAVNHYMPEFEAAVQEKIYG